MCLDVAAGEPSSTTVSTSMALIVTLSSSLRRISKVRSCCGKSRSEAVSTSQKPSSGRLSSGEGNAVTALQWRWPAIQRMTFGQECSLASTSSSVPKALELQDIGCGGFSTPMGQWAAMIMSTPSAWPRSSSRKSQSRRSSSSEMCP